MEARELLRSKKLYVFDLDGTLYMGDRLFDFTKELLETLDSTGRKYVFMTNNSSRSPEDYVKKLACMGIPARKDQVITSSQAVNGYLGEHFRGQPLYVCGTESLIRSMEQEGFLITKDPEKAACVVMTMDTELTYSKLQDVCRILYTRPEIPYVASHPDLVCPTEFGFIPDCGSICRMVYEATGRMPEFLGKPDPRMPKLAMERANCSPQETIVVGDRLSTDIEAGKRAGVDTVLVLTGEAGHPSSRQTQAEPTLILENAGEILKALRD